MEPRMPGAAFDQPQIGIVTCEGRLDLLAVARHERNLHLGKPGRKTGQHLRQNILGDGRTGSHLQFAAQPVGEKIHLVLQTAVAVGNAFGIAPA